MNLDFNQFPTMDKGYLVTPVPSDKLKSYMNVYDRFCSAIYFANSISTENNLNMISPMAQRTAYLRASLSEFVSIEDLLKTKYKNNTLYSLIKSSNPLFHFLKQLRNYNIHLSESNVNEQDISVRIEPDSNTTVYHIKSYYIDNLDINEFMKLDCFTKQQKLYSKNQFERMIAKFEKEQRKFGVGDLLIKGIVEYSLIIEKFLKVAQTDSDQL